MDDRLRQGRNPEWRVAFEEQLNPAGRAEVRRAVTNGRVLHDPRQALLAVGLANRVRRRIALQTLVLLPLQLLFALTWFVLSIPARPGLPLLFAFYWGAAVVAFAVVVPLLLWHRRRMALRAAEANEQIARSAL